MPRRSLITILLVLLAVLPVSAQERITAPKEEFGSNIGDDFFLVNYTRMMTYWQKLDRESERITLIDIGRTAEGRVMTMAVITSAENTPHLSRYREISQPLARSEGLTATQAKSLAADGKAIVWIDGGLHANETLGAQQLVETVYQLVSANDPETVRILNDVIVLACVVNPDGMDLVSNWYMREA